MTLKLSSSAKMFITQTKSFQSEESLPASPKSGEACILTVDDFITEEELKDDLMSPKKCLLPESEWPKVQPKSKVHASGGEWYGHFLRIQTASQCSMELLESIGLK